MNTSALRLCSVCHGLPATQFCCCSGEETFLCEQHGLLHRHEFALHELLPVSCFGQHRVPGYFQRLKHRSESRSTAIQELKENLRLVDRSIVELAIMLEKAVEKIRKLVEKTVSKLETEKKRLECEINRAIEETMAAKYIENPSFTSEIASRLWNFVPGQTNMSLFQYSIIPLQIEELITYEIALPAADSDSESESFAVCLPQIVGNSLKYRDLANGMSFVSTLSETFNSGTVFCQVSNAALLCVGKKTPVQTTFWLCLHTFVLTRMQEMSVARQNPGVVKVGDAVYVFGGYCRSKEATNSAEKFPVETQIWTHLPRMKTARSHFSPCSLRSDIYLVDVCSSRLVEIFNVSSEEFSILPFPLPVSLSSRALTFFIDSELIVAAQSNCVGRWRAGETGFREISTRVERKTVVSNVPPVRLGRMVFWVQASSGKLTAFNAETNAVYALE